MDCHDAAALISARIDGELEDPDEAARLAEHLAGCPACRALEESFRRQDEALRRAFHPSPVADAAFAEQVAVKVPAMVKRRGKPLQVRVGRPISWREMAEIPSAALAMGELRRRVYALGINQ